jgi:hypothetical protein
MKDNLNIYTSLDEAKIEIQKRWKNKELKEKVTKYLGEIPSFFCDEPRAIIFRNIVTPDHELLYFLELADKIELKASGLEFMEDNFCTRNADKLCLGKMAFFEKRNKVEDIVMHYTKVIDLMKNDNKKFSEIKTLGGEKLVDFHHRLLAQSRAKRIEMYDMSQWIAENGGHAREYYKRILAFFICHGVLFESFVTDDSEEVFERDVTLPAIQEIEKLFGVKPLMVQLLPNTEDRYWWCYPKETESLI